ncbi:hypothetical protein BGZ49_003257 [Haplosporangium sp. Z 27]|nr:hypothetical protein BGZ49_003257 [Haplosporangium sp. Z 27]
MSSFIPTLASSSNKGKGDDNGEDHVATQISKFIQLVRSIDYPHDISEEEIHSALSSHYSNNATPNNTSKTTTTFFHDHSSSATPLAKFLDWLVNNVSAETNWPGYQTQRESLENFNDALHHDNFDDEDTILLDLDREHQQLQDTLASLEKELSDLKELETLAIDNNRALDMDIHDTSVQFDATASKLSETAHIVLSEYQTPSSSDMDVDIDMDRSQNGMTEEPRQENHHHPPKRFLYQCQEDLLQIQKLDIEYLENMEGLYQQILDVIDLPRDRTSRSSLGQAPAISHLDRILKRNPEQDQELVRLCSTYRATKMSHIRVMAQLRCIEEELQYMKELEKRHEDSFNDPIGDQDLTGDYRMYTIASTRNQQIQETRQQEIELISVQRETLRLKEEMDQLLSDPSSASQEGGQNLSASMNNNDGAAGGVLVDICELIARSDIELRFLSASHRDYIHEQENALKELDSIMDRLLEYYCLGVTMEQILGVEKNIIQEQKDTLWAAVEELQDFNKQSKRLHHSMDTVIDGNQRSQQLKTRHDGLSQSTGRNELKEAFKRSTDLAIEAQEERQTLQENLSQMFNVREILEKQLLFRHSSTNQVQFVPKDIQMAKDEVINRTRQLQQDYAILNDQVQRLINEKSKNKSS